jgi:hypothetical protein
MRSLELTAGGVGAAALLAAAAVAGLYLFSQRKAIAAAFDPTSSSNLASRGATALTQAVTGDRVNSVGTKFYAWLFGDSMPGISAPVTQADIDRYRRERDAVDVGTMPYDTYGF